MEFLFQLAAYSYPDTITLPKDYVPPKMAIMSAYWKAWQILVLLCAHNPSGFGGYAWKNYPTLRALMEMCITNQFQFPPPTLASGEQVCLTLPRKILLCPINWGTQGTIEISSNE